MPDLWITAILPSFLLEKLGPISLLVIGYLVEKNYVGRIATFSNVVAVNVYSYTLSQPSTFLTWYANIGIIIGAIAIIAYGAEKSLSQYFYAISLAYSSIAAGLVILFL